MNSSLRIAIIGARGIPGLYGGFETFATELSQRLVGRGHDVTVYCHPRYSLPERPAVWNGVHLHYTPAFKSRFFETPVHELFSLKDALTRDFDLLYVLAFRSSLLYVLPRKLGQRIVMNTDGLDWMRSKWNRLGKVYLKFSEMVGVRFASTGLIADSVGMQDYVRETYGAASEFIAYGAPILRSTRPELIEKFGLQPRSYFLVVARMEPENNVHVAVKAFEKLSTDKKLVVVGGANHKGKYYADIRSTGDPRIIFTGPIYDNDLLNELWCDCFAYVHGHQVGGTNPALLQAMGCGALPLARDVCFNREVIGDCGLFWEPNADACAATMNQVLRMPEVVVDSLRAKSQERIASEYNWEGVTEAHERYFRSILRRSVETAAVNEREEAQASAHD